MTTALAPDLPSAPTHAKAPFAFDDQAHRRALELDALGAILPLDRRDQLALLLTHDDIATLKHLAEKSMGANTLRALTSDLGYLEAWAQASTGEPLPWPAPPGLILKFIAYHLWDPAGKEKDDGHRRHQDPPDGGAAGRHEGQLLLALPRPERLPRRARAQVGRGDVQPVPRHRRRPSTSIR